MEEPLEMPIEELLEKLVGGPVEKPVGGLLEKLLEEPVEKSVESHSKTPLGLYLQALPQTLPQSPP